MPLTIAHAISHLYNVVITQAKAPTSGRGSRVGSDVASNALANGLAKFLGIYNKDQLPIRLSLRLAVRRVNFNYFAVNEVFRRKGNLASEGTEFYRADRERLWPFHICAL